MQAEATYHAVGEHGLEVGIQDCDWRDVLSPETNFEQAKEYAEYSDDLKAMVNRQNFAKFFEHDGCTKRISAKYPKTIIGCFRSPIDDAPVTLQPFLNLQHHNLTVPEPAAKAAVQLTDLCADLQRYLRDPLLTDPELIPLVKDLQENVVPDCFTSAFRCLEDFAQLWHPGIRSVADEVMSGPIMLAISSFRGTYITRLQRLNDEIPNIMGKVRDAAILMVQDRFLGAWDTLIEELHSRVVEVLGAYDLDRQHLQQHARGAKGLSTAMRSYAVLSLYCEAVSGGQGHGPVPGYGAGKQTAIDLLLAEAPDVLLPYVHSCLMPSAEQVQILAKCLNDSFRSDPAKVVRADILKDGKVLERCCEQLNLVPRKVVRPIHEHEAGAGADGKEHSVQLQPLDIVSLWLKMLCKVLPWSTRVTQLQHLVRPREAAGASGSDLPCSSSASSNPAISSKAYMRWLSEVVVSVTLLLGFLGATHIESSQPLQLAKTSGGVLSISATFCMHHAVMLGCLHANLGRPTHAHWCALVYPLQQIAW